jgi:predicted CopG family antitoxin
MTLQQGKSRRCSTYSVGLPIVAYLLIVATVHIDKYHDDPQSCMSSATSDAGSQIKRIPVKEPTWRDLHDLKEAGESYDELLSRMIRRERDYRDWKMVVEIEETGEFVAFDPDEILRDD